MSLKSGRSVTVPRHLSGAEAAVAARGGCSSCCGVSGGAPAALPATDCCFPQASLIAKRQAALLLDAGGPGVQAVYPLVTSIYATGLEQPATQVEMGWDRSGCKLWPEHYWANLVTIKHLRPKTDFAML